MSEILCTRSRGYLFISHKLNYNRVINEEKEEGWWLRLLHLNSISIPYIKSIYYRCGVGGS